MQIALIRTSIEQEQLSDEDRESAMELISEAETKIVAQKKEILLPFPILYNAPHQFLLP